MRAPYLNILIAKYFFISFAIVALSQNRARGAEAVDLAYEVRSTMGELNSQKAPSPFTMGIKSQNGLGTIGFLGEYIKTREEVFVGLRSRSGWGFLVADGYSYSNHHHDRGLGLAGADPNQANQQSLHTRQKFNANGSNNQSVDEALSLVDPSGFQDVNFQFFHPITQDESNNLSGMLRTSVPSTERSKSMNSFNYGYNLIYSRHLARQWNFSTVLSLAYMSKDTYSIPFDNIFGEGLINSFNKRLNSWLKLGVGDRIGVTQHTERPTGTSAEVFTTADFLITPSIFMGPRIHFPVYAEGPTYADIPVDPAIKNISADFYIQIAM